MNTIKTWITAALVTVTATLCWAGAQPADRLREQAARQLAINPDRVRLILLDEPGLDGSIADYQFKFGSLPRGRTVVRAESALHRNRSFMVEVQVWDTVLVVQRAILRGQLLSDGAFAPGWRDVTHHSPWPADHLDGMRARRRLAAGVMLTAEAVEPVPLINRGGPVTVKVKAGGIAVSRQGVAMADAQLGQSVRVRVDRRTVLSATAAGPNLCVLEL